MIRYHLEEPKSMGGKASRTINEGNGRLTIGLRLVISVTVAW